MATFAIFSKKAFEVLQVPPSSFLFFFCGHSARIRQFLKNALMAED